MNAILLLLRLTITQLIYTLSDFIPRRHKAVMGCYKDKFADNSKYLFLHWQQQKTIRAIWISADKQLIKRLQTQGYEAYLRWSLLGVWHSATAKFYVYNTYIGDINQYLAKGAVKINLWHGSPLKQIEFDISNGPLFQVYHPQNIMQKLIAKAQYHQQYVRPNLMVAPSDMVKKLFCSGFRINDEQLLTCGNPRTDYYQRYKSEDWLQLQLPINTQQVILYAPSWRDSHLDSATNIYTQAIDFERLSSQLQKSNQCLLLRLHPNEAHLATEMSQYPHIINITFWDDIYGILEKIDLLITDYSSIYIDALQYPCDIAFFLFDKTHYQAECRCEYSYVAELPKAGIDLFNFVELQEYLIEFAQKRHTVTKREAVHSYQAFNRSRLLHTFWQHQNRCGLDCLDAFVQNEQIVATKKPA
ncbi:CDP-glycerol glycerophosphotransferase family protein [Shewanella holmiensis]|uniref:CDP-glycerol glycerophosphotransferase family protein n=1 Tax=Shewanella holmiensis TaxID=2952222 RepID=A0A9X2WNR6_9GAMM|nr:CDP-glycerol glycerophosphotransferase family protein [Shewanella holmiensis]MCT7942584.1 CDP-glycerol glycerophosphotransferase family protein [Shewanella holmiensis]